jgi:hypothetical protein
VAAAYLALALKERSKFNTNNAVSVFTSNLQCNFQFFSLFAKKRLYKNRSETYLDENLAIPI